MPCVMACMGLFAPSNNAYSCLQMEFVDTRTGEVYADGYPQEILDMGEEAFMAAISGQ